jgi:hypothetical protein
VLFLFLPLNLFRLGVTELFHPLTGALLVQINRDSETFVTTPFCLVTGSFAFSQCAQM